MRRLVPFLALPLLLGATVAAAEEALQVESEVGGLDGVAVEAVLGARRGAVEACYAAGTVRLWYLGGRLEVKAQVAPSGRLERAWPVEALGNQEVERCVIEVLRGATWPTPQGGRRGEFTGTWSFRGRGELRTWSEDEVGARCRQGRKELTSCGKRLPAGLRLTFFVGPGGKATSVGVAADAPLDDQIARCVAARVATWTFNDPLGQMARATCRP